MKRLAALALALLAVAGPAAAAAEGEVERESESDSEGGLTLSGSVKGVLLRSEVRMPVRDDVELGLARLRLQVQGEAMPGLALDVQLDEEARAGRPAPDAALRQRVYRASATVSAGALDLRLGRQRIAWGTGRFWSPLDILNPIDPVAIERDERLGVDAALLEARFGAVSRLSAVWAPARGSSPASRAVQWHANAAGIDYSLTAGQLAGQRVAGLDLAGQLGDAGWRAELARVRPEGARADQADWRAMLGADYAFANTLTLSAEWYHERRGTRRAGFSASYEITPLLKGQAFVVANLADHSRGIDARLAWSARQDLDLTLGLQRFAGRPGSEYGRLHHAGFAMLQWYF